MFYCIRVEGTISLIGCMREVKMRRDTFIAKPDPVLDDPVELFGVIYATK